MEVNGKMNSYILLATNNNNDSNQYLTRRTCREFCVRYLYGFMEHSPKKERNVYFGHYKVAGSEKANLKLPELASKIWKDKSIEFELVKLTDIKDSTVAAQYVNIWKEEAPNLLNTQLLKVNKYINPLDLSLLLYLSWWGISNIEETAMKKYLFAKLNTDLIPDLCTEKIGELISSDTVNGPVSFINNMRLSEHTKLTELYNAAGGL
jgi:hypothetical protein